MFVLCVWDFPSWKCIACVFENMASKGSQPLFLRRGRWAFAWTVAEDRWDLLRDVSHRTSSPQLLEATQELCVFLPGCGLYWTRARGGKERESIARCQAHLSSWAGVTAAQTARSWLCPPVPASPPTPTSPPSRLAQVWCICGHWQLSCLQC